MRVVIRVACLLLGRRGGETESDNQQSGNQRGSALKAKIFCSDQLNLLLP
jgi:hypothetical protein